MSKRASINPRLTPRERLIIEAVLEATSLMAAGASPTRTLAGSMRLPVAEALAPVRRPPEPPVDVGSRERFKAPPYLLTPREYEVLDGMARGLRNKQIGLELGISDRTVETHRKRVLAKLDVSSISEFMLKVWAPAAMTDAPRQARNA